jgi:hypothetical protein
MKKRIVSIVSSIAAVLIAFTGSFSCVNAQAADRTTTYLKDADFIEALQGTAKDESDLTIALYEKKDSNLIYFSDGFSEGYSTYTKETVNVKDIGVVYKISIAEGFKLNYYEKDGTPYLETDEGTVFKCKRLTEEEALKLQNK